MPVLLALLATVTLSPPFGEASAETIEFTASELTLEIVVEVDDPGALVLLRVIDVAGNERGPTALIAREDGRFGAVVKLPRRADLRVGFELVSPTGGSQVSETSSLIELGVEPALLGISPPQPGDSDDGGPGIGWMLVAVVAALAALALVLLWLRLGRADGPDPGDDADQWRDGYDGVQSTGADSGT